MLIGVETDVRADGRPTVVSNGMSNSKPMMPA